MSITKNQDTPSSKESSAPESLDERDQDEDDVAIDFGELQFGKKLGAGSFGDVYLGRWHGSVAIKRLRVTNPTDEQLRMWTNEISILK
jgi:serine/threonine protein kinase